MITLRVTADITDDRRVVLTLPPDVPTGTAELTVTIDSSAAAAGHPSPSLPDYAEVETGCNGANGEG